MAVIENLKIVPRSAVKDLSDESMGKNWEAITERIKKRTPECPLGDGEKGRFVRMAGWQGAAIYKCPNGHRFSMLGDNIKILED